MKRKIEDIQKDLDYIRTLEDGIAIFLMTNKAYSVYKKILGEDNKLNEKINDTTLEYLNKLKVIRQECEKEREDLLHSNNNMKNNSYR